MRSTLLPSIALFALAAYARPSANQVQFAGVNIAGFDFGCTNDGACDLGQVEPPLSEAGGADGAGQMQHFVKDDGLNIFRLPVAWQYLVNNVVGGPLDAGNFAQYDALVQACVRTGVKCVVDVHNYARWNGGVIGQGGPADDQLASLWTQLAQKYATAEAVVFGIMNEPHDVDINLWAKTVQAVVTAIRNAGASTQMILLPGNDWTSLSGFDDNGSLDQLSKVTNPDGSTINLVFDVHQYLDSDTSGTHTECVDSHEADVTGLANSLRKAGNRQALLSETGGGNTQSCQQAMCAQIAALNANSDVFLGYIGWAAGAFPPNYELLETPTNNNGVWTDTPLVSECIKRH